jgi:hypothetical protein
MQYRIVGRCQLHFWRLQLLKLASIFHAVEPSADRGKTQGPATIAVLNSIDVSAVFWLARLG